MPIIGTQLLALPRGVENFTQEAFGIGKTGGNDPTAAGGVVTIPSGYLVAFPLQNGRAQLLRFTEAVGIPAVDGDEVYITLRSARVEVAAAASTPIGSLRLGTASGTPVDTFTQDAKVGGIQIVSFLGQEFSIDFDGATEHMQSATQSAPPRIGIGQTFTIACWFKTLVEPAVGSHDLWAITPVPSNAGNGINMSQNVTGTNSLWIQIVDNGNAVRQSVSWSNLFPGPSPTWHHAVLQWTGAADATRKLYFDGVDQGAPDTITANSAGVNDDLSNRFVAFGKNSVTGRWDGRGASLAMWPTILTAAEITAIYNGGVINFDLNADSAGYVSAADLVHWMEVGKLVSPDLGIDSAVLSANPLDLIDAAVGITDADRVSDVP